jgi:hypothetical protein
MIDQLKHQLKVDNSKLFDN